MALSHCHVTMPLICHGDLLTFMKEDLGRSLTLHDQIRQSIEVNPQCTLHLCDNNRRVAGLLWTRVPTSAQRPTQRHPGNQCRSAGGISMQHHGI